MAEMQGSGGTVAINGEPFAVKSWALSLDAAAAGAGRQSAPANLGVAASYSVATQFMHAPGGRRRVRATGKTGHRRRRA